MTFGHLKIRLVQLFPSVSLDILEGFIQDRYDEILSEIPWQRQHIQGVLETTAPYSAGTVVVVQGSAAITGTGTAWTTQMSGRAFRPAGRNEWYAFTWLTATTGTLDRPYEGPAAPLAGYSIFQTVYPLPADCRLLEDDAFTGPWGAGQRFAHSQLSRYAWLQAASGWGAPGAWASCMDSNTTPPLMQVELYWAPATAVGIPFTYVAEVPDLSGTSTLLRAWIDPTAMIEGVIARTKRHLKDYPGAQLAEIVAKNALAGMRREEAHGMARTQMVLDPHYTNYRRRR